MMRSLHPLLAVVTRGGCWAGLLLFAAFSVAQTPPAAPPLAKVRLAAEPPRTVRVPLAELPRHIAGLVPIRRTDFNRLWPLYAPVDDAAAAPRITISAIDYRLALNEAKTLLSGTVAYQVRVLDERPAAIEIEPAQFTWSNLQWKSAAEPGLRGDQLVMGAAPDGRWRLLAPHSGILSCNLTFSIAPEPPAAAEAPGFAVALPAPPGAQARLTLDLPDGWVTEPRPGVLWESSALVDASAPAGKRIRRHPAVLTGKNAVAVGSSPGRGPRRATQYAVRESNHYSLLPGRIELETSLELDILRDQLDSLVLQLDPGLTVHRIRWGEQALAWSPTGPGERRISVALPEPLRGSSRLVQVSAAANWGPAERITLPRIRVPQAIWRQGRSTVATPPWLAADCLPTGCRLTLANLDPAGQEPDLRQFVFDEAGAKVELLRAPAAGALSVDSGVVFTAAPNQLTAFLRADLRASGGDRFETVCEFAAGWIVESVETQPLNQMEARVIRTEGERQSWQLRWKTPLGDEPLRLLVRARRPGANASAPLTDSDCFPFDFPQAWRHNRWLAVASSDRRQQFLLARAEGVSVAAFSELSASDTERLQGAPSGALVVNLPEISGQPLWLRQASEPAKIGQPRVDLFVTDGRLTTRWSVPCRARDELVERLLITLSPPPAEDLIWTLQRETTTAGGPAQSSLAGEVVARRLAPGELTIPNSAAWELRLQPSAAGDFSLRAEHTQPFLGPVRAPLLIANDRIGGVGQVNVSWSSAAPPQLAPVGLTPLLTGEAPLETGTGAPWSYRYGSEQTAGLTVTPAGAIATAPLWCSEALFFSRIDHTGGLQTEVQLQLRGDFSRPLRFQPPAGAEIVAARWSHGEAAPISAADAHGWRSIALSGGSDAARVRQVSGPAGESAETLTLSLETPPRSGVWLPAFRRPELILACPLAVRREFAMLPSDHLFLPGTGVRPAGSGEIEEVSPLRERFNDLQSATVWAVDDSRRALGYASWNLFRWAAAIAIFATAYLTLRLANRALGGISLAALALGIASQQLPQQLGLLAEAVAAGAFAGLLIYAWSPRRAAAPLRDANAVGRAALRVTVLALGWAMAVSGALFGQPPALNPAAPERLTIVDPINEQLAPAGDYLYVSPKLYDALYLRGQTLDADQPACLIRAARYELRDLPRRENEPRPAPQLVVRLELQVREAARRIELPFRRDQLRLGAVEDSRTGQRLAGEWSPAGDFLWIEAPQRGAVSLKLELWPIAAGNSTLSIQIPRCPDALAEFTDSGEWTFLAPRETPSVGAAKGVPAPRALGAADALRLYLPVTGEVAPLPEPEVELITWWKLRENSAAAEVMLRTLRGGGDVRLRVDGTLKPLGSGPRLTAAGSADEQGRNAYLLTLGAPAPDKLSTEFILASAPTGLFAPPQVECLGAKVVRSRLLVSYAAELDCQGPASTWPLEQARAQTPELPTERLLAYELTAAAPPQFTVRGVQPKWSVDLEARWRLLTREARAEFRCQLSALGRQPSDLVIDLPPSLLVLDVQTAEAGVTTACRWRRQPGGRVAVLLPQGSSAEREVVLTCLLPRGGEACELPAPRFPASQAGNTSFLIFRTPNLPVTVEPQAGWVNHLTPPPEFIDPVWGRAAIALAPDPDLSPSAVVARCRWVESTPPLTGRQITLVRGGSGWTADLLCELDAGDQPLDALAWEIPAEWQGKLETSDASLRLVEQPSAALGKRVLSGQFAVPRNGKISVRLTGKFPLAEGSTIVTPSFRLLEHSQVRRLVALPIQAAGEALTWETTGLRAAERDELTADPLFSGCQLWEVAEERQQASTSTERRDLPPLRIDWMDVELSSPAAGMWRLQVELGVVPGGRHSCQLALPGARLLAAAIGGRAARVETTAAGTWEVELLSPHAPQRLELLWDFSEQPAESAFPTLALPEVLGGEVARTCIRLRPAPESGAAGISAAAIRPLAQADQLQERLTALTAWRDLDRAGEVVWIHPPAQRAWWSGLQAEIDQVEAALAEPPAAAPPRQEQIWGADGPVERIVLHPAPRESLAGGYYGLVILGLLLSGAMYWTRGWLAAFAADFYAFHPRWCFLAAAACAWLLMAPLWLPLGLAAVGLLPHFARSTS